MLANNHNPVTAEGIPKTKANRATPRSDAAKDINRNRLFSGMVVVFGSTMRLKTLQNIPVVAVKMTNIARSMNTLPEIDDGAMTEWSKIEMGVAEVLLAIVHVV